MTYALIGMKTDKLSAMEAYGLHCAWELEYEEDERAPEKMDTESGLKILRKYNEDLVK